MTRTMTKIAALIALFVAAFTSLPARADTTVLSDVSWERTTNYHIGPSHHNSGSPAPYYGLEASTWSFSSAEVWNRTQSDGFQWFYTRDYSGDCGVRGTRYWFRTTVTSPDGGRIVGVRVFDREEPSAVHVNDAAFLFVNGVEVDGTGLWAGTGTARYLRRRPMGWQDRPLAAPEATLDPTTNEIAILFEEGCGDGGLGRLAIEVITEAADSDGDGVLDHEDACPGFDDGLDADSDGVPDGCDLCLGDDASGDDDSDSVCSNIDNCPSDANPAQEDADGDGIGDVCEADTDEDGLIDDIDNCPAGFNPSQSDNDADGAGDVCDEDDDNDGILDTADNCALLANADQVDFDGDGLGDACDGDDDADAVSDEDDLCPGSPLDSLTDESGCSGEQRVDLLCIDPGAHRNHGAYVSCVAHASQQAVQDGLLTSRERAAIVRAAAHR